MKKLAITIMLVLSLIFVGLSNTVYADDCSSGIYQLENMGHLTVRINDGEIYAGFEMLLWKTMTYIEKRNLMICIMETYNISKICVFALGTSNILAKYSKKYGFQIYK